jgi:hypothetical protein
MTDEDGVLENLPRSRPGQRSDKRSATPNEAAKPDLSASAPKRAKPAAAKAKPATKHAKSAAKQAKPAAQEPKPASRPKPRTAPAQPAAEKPPPVGQEAQSGGSNPVGEVVRTVSSLAGGGARAARDVARGVLRRLPRP